MKIEDKIATLNYSRKPYTCSPGMTVEDVLYIMRRNDFGSIIVTEDDEVVGIFTERDFFVKMGTEADQYAKDPISNFMTKFPTCLNPEKDTIETALKKMRQGHFRHIILVDEHERLCGVVSIKDIAWQLVPED